MLGQHLADVQRRFDQPCLLGTEVDPAHMPGLGCDGKPMGQGRQRTRTLFELGEVRRRLCHGRRGQCASGTGLGQGLQGGWQIRLAVLPAPLLQAPHVTDGAGTGQAQLARGAVDARLQFGPGLQAAGMSQAGGQQVAGHVDGLPGGQRGAQKLHTGLDELVRFVEDRRIHRRQQLGHSAVAQGHVGEEQVVVDDHQVGRHGLAPGLHDVAGPVLRALGTQAVLPRRCNQRDDGRPIIQTFHLCQVAAAGGLRPLAHTMQRANGKTVG